MKFSDTGIFLRIMEFPLYCIPDSGISDKQIRPGNHAISGPLFYVGISD